jgi:preprotein translocase subunit SecB
MEKLKLLLVHGPRLNYCNFELREVKNKPKEKLQIECNYSIELNIKDNKKEFIASISAKSKSENVPFAFDVKSEALFKCENECPSEEIAITEAIPYIYSFIKEMVADLTRKAYIAPFYLPPIDLDSNNYKKIPGTGY